MLPSTKNKRDPTAPSLLERIIYYFSPQWALRRQLARSAYEAAGYNRTRDGWYPPDGVAEVLNAQDREMIRKRARDLERNSDIANAMISAYERNVVGSGFMVQADTGNETLNKRIEAAFREWCKPQNCDITGQQSFLEMCYTAVRRMRVDGGLLFLKSRSGGDARFPFQLQTREVSDLDETYDHAMADASGNLVVGGVELTKKGKPVAYYLRQYTPDGWYEAEPIRVKAQDVIALWKKMRPSQVREISPLAVSIARIRDTEDYIYTFGVKEKILACMSIFISRQEPQGIGRVGPGRGGSRGGTSYDGLELSPGMVTELQPGDNVQAVIPQGQANNTKDAVSMYHHLMAAGQGISYETLARDMSQTNYSSARQGLLEDRRIYQREQQFLIDHFLTVVYEEFLTSAVMAGTVKIPHFWTNREKYLKHTWTCPGWSWIDPLKEVNANIAAIESGQETLAGVCAKAGTDWRELMEQRAQELKYMQDLEARYGVSFTAPGKGGQANAEDEQDNAPSDDGGADSGDGDTGQQ